jgi:predicted extracellular nuclease
MKQLSAFILIIIFLTTTCKAQSEDTLYVAFWNLQNLFDVIDDPEKNDESFLPDGDMEWTADRLDKKMYNLARIIRCMNDENGPDLLGVCEVENKAVLDSLVNKFLSDLNYKTAYLESPDNRGIDNGLIYKATKFKILNVQADTVHLFDNWPTRLIFGTNLLTNKNEKITVFVNHWPSRRGGQDESEPNRIVAAKTLRSTVDRIYSTDADAKIFIIGDFNDEPTNASVLNHLKAAPIFCDSLNTVPLIQDKTSDLFNLSYSAYNDGLGSYKYKDDWNMLDQIIISKSLITDENFNYICNSFKIFKPNLLVTQSGKYKDTPFPTYGGRRYLGGYSDHFPVIAKFLIGYN